MQDNKSFRLVLVTLAAIFLFTAPPLFAQQEMDDFRREMEENLSFMNLDLGGYRDALRKIGREKQVDAVALSGLEKEYDSLREKLQYIDREFQSFRVETILSGISSREYDLEKRQNLDLRFKRIDRDFFGFAQKLNQITPIKIRDRAVLQDADLAGDRMMGQANPALYHPETPENPASTAAEEGRKPGLGNFSAADLTFEEGQGSTEWVLKGTLTTKLSHHEVDGAKTKFEQDNYGLFAGDNATLQCALDFNEIPEESATGVTFGSLSVDSNRSDSLRETVNLKVGGKNFTTQIGTKLLPELSEFTLSNLELQAAMADLKRGRWTLGAFAGNVNIDAAAGVRKEDRKVTGGTAGYRFSERTNSTAIFSEVRDVRTAALKVTHEIPSQGNVGLELANSEDANAAHLKGTAMRALFKANRDRWVLDGEYLNLDDDFRTQGNPEYAARTSDLKQFTLNHNFKFTKDLRAVSQYVHSDEGNARASIAIPTINKDRSLLLLYTNPKAPKLTLLVKRTDKDGSTNTLGSVDDATSFNLFKIAKKILKTETELSYLTVDYDSTGSSNSSAVNYKLKNPAMKLTTQWDRRTSTYLNYSFQDTTGSTENKVYYLETRAEFKLNDFRKVFASFSRRKLTSDVTTDRDKREISMGYTHVPKKDYELTYALRFIENDEAGSDYESRGGSIQFKRKF